MLAAGVLGALRVLEESGHDYAVVMAAGDDTTDESMFRLDVPGLVTVKVGEGDTHAHAQLRVRTPADSREFLAIAVTAAD